MDKKKVKKTVKPAEKKDLKLAKPERKTSYLPDLISRLQAKLGPKNSAIAKALAEKYSADLINLAYRLSPKRNLSHLSKTEEKIAAKLREVSPRRQMLISRSVCLPGRQSWTPSTGDVSPVDSPSGRSARSWRTYHAGAQP